jgi:POTRA domain, FtsQ-type.
MIKKSRKNKQKKPFWQLLIPIAKTLPFFAVLAFVIFTVLKSNPTEFLEVNINWDIGQESNVSQKALLNKIQPLIKDKYQLDLHQIRQTLEQDPWVYKAHIKRLFWNSIRITIDQQKIAMRWKNKQNCKPKQNNNSCIGYISKNGELFIPKNKSNLMLFWQSQAMIKKLLLNCIKTISATRH